MTCERDTTLARYWHLPRGRKQCHFWWTEVSWKTSMEEEQCLVPSHRLHWWILTLKLKPKLMTIMTIPQRAEKVNVMINIMRCMSERGFISVLSELLLQCPCFFPPLFFHLHFIVYCIVLQCTTTINWKNQEFLCSNVNKLRRRKHVYNHWCEVCRWDTIYVEKAIFTNSSHFDVTTLCMSEKCLAISDNDMSVKISVVEY